MGVATKICGARPLQNTVLERRLLTRTRRFVLPSATKFGRDLDARLDPQIRPDVGGVVVPDAMRHGSASRSAFPRNSLSVSWTGHPDPLGSHEGIFEDFCAREDIDDVLRDAGEHLVDAVLSVVNKNPLFGFGRRSSAWSSMSVMPSIAVREGPSLKPPSYRPGRRRGLVNS